MAKQKLVSIKLVKSGIGYSDRQKRTLVGLGLTKLNKTRTFKDTPEVRGMINKVSHLVEVSEAGG